MTLIADKIKQKVHEIEPFLVETRRYLHQHPELSGHELNTSSYINNKLSALGLKTEILETESGPAVIAFVNGNSSNTIAFRADMDALPLCEKSDKIYCSKEPGIMHACGHDFHVTSIIGTAYALASLANDLKVNVKFIFQPSEETTCGGAAALINMGVLEGVNSIFTIHAMPELKVGQIGIKFGPCTASIDCFKVKVIGKGGHSARPHLAHDAISASIRMINYLYSDISRQINPVFPIVLTIGKINAGTAPNIIAEESTFEGTVRTFSPDIRQNVHDLIFKKLEMISNSLDVKVEIEWNAGSPPVINNEKLAILAEKSSYALFGHDSVIRFNEPSMGAEDFARYTEHIPGFLIRMGTGSENCCYPLHTCKFDVDDHALMYSVSLLSLIAFNYSLDINKDFESINE